MKTRYFTRSLTLCLLIVGMSFASAFAEDAKPTANPSASSSDDDSASIKTFQCRKITGSGSGLSELKESLMKNCNLDKPFSLSNTPLMIGGGSVFVFCCSTKAGS